jgi:hypothetical protein
MSIYQSTFCAVHARHWLKALGKSRVLFLQYDLLRKDPVQFVQAATDFLGIRPLRRVDGRKINMGFALKQDGDCLLPVIEPLETSENQVTPRFALSDLQQLLALFKKDIAKTEKAIGIDLSHWKTLPRFGE